MEPKYIIVQAGGKGTRMKHLTHNKPKALVPVGNLPILFHLFKKYPNSKYTIIGDYHYDVLQRYLSTFAKVDFRLVCGSGKSGTCAGLRQALEKLPPTEPFLLIWSDLILPEDFELPSEPGNYIGIAKDFSCRWTYQNGIFAEKQSETFGVAGAFWFKNTAVIQDVPEEGEFVRWLARTGKHFESMPLHHVKEYGLLEEYEKSDTVHCRPFNRVYVDGNQLVKEPVDTQGAALAVREIAWYQRLESCGFKNIPDIFCYQPLKMEYIDVGPIYSCTGLSIEERISILEQVIGCLRSIHLLDTIPADHDSYQEAYIGKTFQRLEKVRNLVPFAQDKFVWVNGRRCRNVFEYRTELCEEIEQYMPDAFVLIHGDCTFSNTMLRRNGDPILIDPRGYFGNTELYGDPAYDWAKLYYSIVGNYDQFNRKHFSLKIEEKNVQLQIESNGWEDMESRFFQMLQGEVTVRQIRFLHAIIWLSLTTYAWDDYDSICGAFYNGLYYLEEAFNEKLF